MDWFIERLQQVSPTLDYRDLSNYENDFRKLIEQNIIKHTDTLDQLPCDLCEEDHSVSLFRNKNNEIVISCSGSSRIVNPDELKIWSINREVLTENIKSKTPIIDRVLFEKTAFAENKNGDFRIIKEGDDYKYKGNIITSKNADWFKVFDSLYDIIPEGGEISYSRLGEQVKSKLKKSKNYKTKQMTKFVQTNLTDKSNGFGHYAGIPSSEENGKPLLYVKRGKGIIFNNRIS